MKAPLKSNANVAFSIIVAMFLAGGCDQTAKQRSTTLALPFTFTNVFDDKGLSSLIIRATNGLSCAIDQDSVTLYFGLNDSVTAYFDPQTHKPKKIVLETSSSTNGLGQWVTDSNADGVPDSRRIKGRNWLEVFFAGQWYRTTLLGVSNLVINVDGRVINVRHDGINWIEVAKPD